jgi:hypothetical protein
VEEISRYYKGDGTEESIEEGIEQLLKKETTSY